MKLASLVALSSVQAHCPTRLAGLPRATIAPVARCSSGAVMLRNVDHYGEDSWDEQLAEQGQWMTEQQMGARAVGPWQEQQHLADARRELHETRRKLKADSHQLQGFRHAIEDECDALQLELGHLDAVQQQLRNAAPGRRHDELSAVRQAAWMAEQQMQQVYQKLAWLGLTLFQDYAALCTTCDTPD